MAIAALLAMVILFSGAAEVPECRPAASRLTLGDAGAKREFIYGDSFVSEVRQNMNLQWRTGFCGMECHRRGMATMDYSGLM